MLKRILLVLILTLGSLFSVGHTQEMITLTGQEVSGVSGKHLEAFRRLPILHEGRVKPLETYARNVLLRFSGSCSFKKTSTINGRPVREPAIAWLARVLFLPTSTRDDAIFLINNPEIPMALGVMPLKSRRYTFATLQPGLNKLLELVGAAQRIPEKQRSIVEKEVIRVYANLVLFGQLTHSLSFAFPDEDFMLTDTEVLETLNLPSTGPYTYLQMATRLHQLQGMIEENRDKDPNTWSLKEKQIFDILRNVYQWQIFNQELPMALIPVGGRGQEAWVSLWDAVVHLWEVSAVQEELLLLGKMRAQYTLSEGLAFDLSAKALAQSMIPRMTPLQQAAAKRIPLEVLYHRLAGFTWAKLFYALSCSVFLVFLLKPFKGGRVVGLFLLVLGFVPQTVALIMRMSIMHRPPVTNLYETFIFVGWISVLCGFILEWVNKRWLGIIVGAISGLSFLMIAGKFSAEGDTMRMMVAVLDSNFWLSTHVITITIGYAGCCVAGILGHIYIVQAIFRSTDKPLLEGTYRNLWGALCFGLMATFLGTILGGIWADQSWGRFWGWDPKENGALMIVLWTALILHARMGRMLSPLGVALMSVLGILVVAWAWFGVNLLSVGLHSYGFTSGMLRNLILVGVAEIAFVAFLGPLASKRLKVI